MELKEGISYDKNKNLWIHNDNKCIGYIKFFVSKYRLDINQIYIYPDYRGHGFGKKSLEMLISDYENINEIVLLAYGEMGCEMNLYKYYESIGFKKFGKSTVISIENNDYMRQYMKYYKG